MGAAGHAARHLGPAITFADRSRRSYNADDNDDQKVPAPLLEHCTATGADYERLPLIASLQPGCPGEDAPQHS